MTEKSIKNCNVARRVRELNATLDSIKLYIFYAQEDGDAGLSDSLKADACKIRAELASIV